MNTGRTHFKKGYTPWNKGNKLSAEHKEKLSKAKENYIPWNKGLYGINMGENNPNWKGGKSGEIKLLRSTSHYSDWRTNVFNRDDYTCQSCGFRGNSGYITAHHIKSVSRYPEEVFCLENGMTLCEPCHSNTDNYKGRAKGRD